MYQECPADSFGEKREKSKLAFSLSNITTNEIYIMNFRSTNIKRYLSSFVLTMPDENCCQIYSGTQEAVYMVKIITAHN
jgi:hypothetical protein